MNFAIIGTGSFGIKRAKAIKDSAKGELVAFYDTNKDNIEKVKKDLNVDYLELSEIFKRKDIDIVAISTPNKFHKKLIIDGLSNDKHIFCEKPLCKNLDEAAEILQHAKKSTRKVQIGSNHRYFESVKYAKKIIDEGKIGKPLSFKGRIGHNGERIKNTWFWKKDLSGGGTLLDNGCHLLDLSRYFMGNFNKGYGICSNSYWKDKIEVEDTAQCIFSGNNGITSSIFCSWRLLSGYFFFEINGTDGYLNVDGRFDTHGGDMVYWKNKDNNQIISEDFSKIKPDSYLQEINAFIENIEKNKTCSPSIDDAVEVMKMIDWVYKN